VDLLVAHRGELLAEASHELAVGGIAGGHGATVVEWRRSGRGGWRGPGPIGGESTPRAVEVQKNPSNVPGSWKSQAVRQERASERATMM
jgi:hypothetical protein